jgi:hypothetical protein
LLQIWLQKKILLSIAFGELAAIFAAIHLGLMSGSNWCAITITLHGKWYQRHVWIGALTVPAEVDAP